MSRAAQTTPPPETTTAPEPSAPDKSNLDAELQRLDRERARVPVVGGQFVPDSLEGYQRLAKAYILADLVPYTFKAKRNDSQLLACVTLVLAAGMGSLKLTPEQALASMMVVNNRTALFGDALPALIRRSGLCLGIDERIIGEGDNRVAVCKITRLHKLPDGSTEREIVERRFSVADAKKAKLWQKKGYEGKDTPWITHEERMLQMRARGFAARDGWADVLMGMGIVEELQDIPPDAQDKAVATQAAIDALKPAQEAPKAPTPLGASKAKGGQAAQTPTAPEPEPVDGSGPQGDEGQDDENESVPPARGIVSGVVLPDEDSQLGPNGECPQCGQSDCRCDPVEDPTGTQPTSKGVQQVQAHNVSAKPKRSGKSIGDASAEPPPGLLLGQQSKPPERPWGTRKN